MPMFYFKHGTSDDIPYSSIHHNVNHQHVFKLKVQIRIHTFCINKKSSPNTEQKPKPKYGKTAITRSTPMPMNGKMYMDLNNFHTRWKCIEREFDFEALKTVNIFSFEWNIQHVHVSMILLKAIFNFIQLNRNYNLCFCLAFAHIQTPNIEHRSGELCWYGCAAIFWTMDFEFWKILA